VDRGYFTVMLGEGTSVPGAPFTNNLATIFSGPNASDRYLEITVGGLAPGDPPIAPRLRLLASPYSFLAQKAINAGALVNDANVPIVSATGTNLTVSGSVNAATLSGSLDGANLIDGTVSSNKLADGSVIANKLADGSITTNKLAANVGLWNKAGTNLNFIAGTVGIGTASPAQPNKLQINDYPDPRVTGSGYALAANGSGFGADVQILRNYGLGGIGLVVDNVGYGSTSTSLLLVRNNLAWNLGAGGALGVPLDVRADANSGASYVTIGNYGPGGYNLSVNGSVGAASFSTGSDARLKKNIHALTNAVSTVTRLRGVSYDWRQEDFPDRVLDNRRHLGFIAQEVEEILPDVVSKSPDGFRAVAYTEVIPLLTEAIKEQQAHIKSLERRLADLEAKAAVSPLDR